MRHGSILARKEADGIGESLLYQSKIIKAGALLADTKTLLAHWDETCSVSENLARFRRENIFGKASRSRVEDILLNPPLPKGDSAKRRGICIEPQSIMG
jgi:hypothetical protein